MSLKKRVILLIILLNLTASIFIYLVTQLILLNNLASIEQLIIKNNVSLVEKGLESRARSLDTTATDYATWDDTYYYMTYKNSNYIDTNFVPDTYQNLKINIFALVDNKNNMVFGSAYDTVANQEVEFPEELKKTLENDIYITTHPLTTSSVSGIISVSKRPLILTSKPILTSSGNGPVMGSLIMGRYLGNEEIAELKDTTNLYLNIYTIEDFKSLHNENYSKVKDKTTYVDLTDMNQAYGYKVINDVYNTPAIVLEVMTGRTIYLEGQRAIRYLFATFLLIGFASLIVGTTFIARAILRPLSKLILDINAIRNKGDLTKRVEVVDNGDIGILARHINQMLEYIQGSESKLKESNTSLVEKTMKLSKKTKELEEMNKIMVGREIKMSELKEELDKLKKQVNDIKK